jgi:hypothetical protein
MVLELIMNEFLTGERVRGCTGAVRYYLAAVRRSQKLHLLLIAADTLGSPECK